MDRLNYYYGELVQEDELDLGFTYGEQADRDQNRDCGLIGIVVPRYAQGTPPPDSWTTEENAVPDWNVRVNTGYAYDKLGQRIAVDPPVTVLLDCEEDYLGNPNAVAAGNERFISIFLKFRRALSDPRIDDHGTTVYFEEEESYELEVRQGPEEAIPATTRPALDSTDILIADILIDNGTPPILNAAIDLQTRVEYNVNFDVTALLPAPWVPLWTGPQRIVGRNPMETTWFMLYTVLYAAENYLLDVYGNNDLQGDLDPQTACMYDLGGKRRFRKIGAQMFDEYPDATDSGPSLSGANPDWDDVPLAYGHAFEGHAIRSIDNMKVRWRDLGGRDQKQYKEFVDDFQKDDDPDAHRYTVSVGAGSSVTPNPAPYALTFPGGHVILSAGAPTPSTASFTGSTFPLYGFAPNAWQPYVEAGIVLLSALNGQERIIIGMSSAGGVAGFAFMYDPATLLTNTWWAYYTDGVNAPILVDTLVPGPATGVARKLAVAFERNAGTGDIWAVWYIDNLLVHSVNLTALPLYMAQLALLAWDVSVYLRTLAGVAASDLLVDYVKEMQYRADLI